MPEPLRIAIDGRTLTGRFTGDRTYWRNLIHSLAKIDPTTQYLIYTRTPLPEGELPPAPNLLLKRIEAPNDRLWTLRALPQALREDRADLLHVQYTIPPNCPCPVITSVHDISFRLYPQWFPFKHRLLLNLTVPVSMRRANRVITLSEESRQQMIRVYGLPKEHIEVTPLGVSEGFEIPAEYASLSTVELQEKARQITKERLGIAEPFVLAVGVIQPRKNLPTLVEAFGRAKKRTNLPHILVLTGKPGWGAQEQELYRLFTQTGAPQEALRFTGYVEDDLLPWLYRASCAFAFPSLYEGFGIPSLEGMASAVPTLVSDAPPLPEVVGDGAMIVPVRSVEAWTDAIIQILTDTSLQQSLIRRGVARASLFTWEETARQTRALYTDVLNTTRSPK